MTRIVMSYRRAADAGDPAPEVPELSCGETSSSDGSSTPSIYTEEGSDSETAMRPYEGVGTATELNVPARYSRISPEHQTPLDEKPRPLLSKEDEQWLEFARAVRRRDRHFASYCRNIALPERDDDEFESRLKMMQEVCLGGKEAKDDDDDDSEDDDDDDDDDDGDEDDGEDDIFYLLPADKVPFPPYRLALPLEVSSGHDACDDREIVVCQPAYMCPPDAQIKATMVAHGRLFGVYNPWQAVPPDLSAWGNQAGGHGRPSERDVRGTERHRPHGERSDEWVMIDGIWVRN